MKKTVLLVMVLSVSTFVAVSQKENNTPNYQSKAATINDTTCIELLDDFEEGDGNWTVFLSGLWGLTSSLSYSPSHSLTDSPTGNYLNNQESFCTMANGVDLSSRMSAEVSFYARYELESGFDYIYLDVSNDNFVTCTNLANFNGIVTAWTQYTYSLGGFVGPGYDNVKVRFRFISDQGLVMDGMYIDDFIITSSSEDNAPPLILSTFPEFYEGSPGEFIVEADITDISGLSMAQCSYKVDGVAQANINGVNAGGVHYIFTIPVQPAGANVDYSIIATDASASGNISVSPVASYISGEYYKYDNAQANYYIQFTQGQGACVLFSLNGPTRLATALIRNYTDAGNPNAKMLFHVWSQNLTATGPGANLITPFTVTPEASIINPSPMTRIDLRPYASQLNNLRGDIYIGFTVPGNSVNILETEPDIGGRSFFLDGTSWGSVNADYHFRLITAGAGVGICEFPGENVLVYPNPMSQYAFLELEYSLRHPHVKLFCLDGREFEIRQDVDGNLIQLLRGNLPPGIYLLKVFDDQLLINQQKLIIW